MPYLTDKALALVGRMDSSKSSDYNEVKSLILSEFKLTSNGIRLQQKLATKLIQCLLVVYIHCCNII